MKEVILSNCQMKTNKKRCKNAKQNKEYAKMQNQFKKRQNNIKQIIKKYNTTYKK